MPAKPCTPSLPQFEDDHPDRDVAAFKKALANKLIYAVGKDPVAARPEDWLHDTQLAVRAQLVERWMAPTRAQYAPDATRSFNASARPGLEAAACLIFFTCGIGSIQTRQFGSCGLN